MHQVVCLVCSGQHEVWKCERFKKAYHIKKKGRSCNEVDFVTSVYQKGTLLTNPQKLTLSANTLDVEEVTTP